MNSCYYYYCYYYHCYYCYHYFCHYYFCHVLGLFHALQSFVEVASRFVQRGVLFWACLGVRSALCL